MDVGVASCAQVGSKGSIGESKDGECEAVVDGEDLEVGVLLGANFEVNVPAVALHAVEKLELIGRSRVVEGATVLVRGALALAKTTRKELCGVFGHLLT